MKSKTWLPLLFLLVIPLIIAQEQNLFYDTTENIVKLSYDELNRIIHKNSSSEIINYTYDKQLQGTLNNISFGNATYKYTYDDRLRVIEEKRIIDGIEFTKTYAYDSNDRLLSQIFNGQDLDYYYSPNSKIEKINGFVNDTNFNPFGNPSNRTYFNKKLTEFSYNTNNARLKQILTDTSQNLTYTYDNVGNIKQIEDDVNNRTYSMTYDNLDRLTNVSIGAYKWVYNYDAIGNILKIVRNHSTTTSFKYQSGLAHTPSKVLTKDTAVDIYRTSINNTNNRTQVLKFYLVNEKNDSLTNLNYSIHFGDNFVFNSSSINLSLNNYSLISVEHNYSSGGNYKINITSLSSTGSDFEPVNLLFGTKATSLGILKKNASLIVTEFYAKNTINQQSNDWSWNCSNGLFSNQEFNLSANQELLVIIEHNYSLSSLTKNLTCIANSSDGNESFTINFELDGIKIINYNSTKTDSDSLEVKFQIINYFSALDINWNITAGNIVINNSEPISMNQGQTTTITQQLNFTNAGLKPIKITIFSGNFTDSYAENVKLYSLGVQDFFNLVKNGTARILNFFVKNDWVNLSAKWNISEPALQNNSILANNESIIVVIEENFGQGRKEAKVQVFNSSNLEDIELDIFRIKQIGINEFEILYENKTKAVSSALIINNIAPLNISWQLNNTESLILSSQNLELNDSEQAFVVIESNFTSSGIYPLTFQINSSTYNDNQTSTIVT